MLYGDGHSQPGLQAKGLKGGNTFSRRMTIILKFCAILVPTWAVCAGVVYLVPTWALKSLLRPSAAIFRNIGSFVEPLFRLKPIHRLVSLLPLFNLLTFLNLGYDHMEINQIEFGVAIYLLLEGLCYYLYRVRVNNLIKFPPQRSHIDQNMMLRIADQFVADTTPEDIVKFIVYAFYCLSANDTDPHETSEDISNSDSIWHGHYKLSQRFNIDFPLLTKDDLVSYLQENLGLEPWHTDCMIERIEAKVGTVFPKCSEGVIETQSTTLNHIPFEIWQEEKKENISKRPLTPLVNRSRYHVSQGFPDIGVRLQPLTEHHILEEDDAFCLSTPVVQPHASATEDSKEPGEVGKSAKKVAAPSSQQSAVNERSFVYGNNELEPIYRPIFICFIIHLAHQIICRIALPLLGFVRYSSLRHDMRAVMGFYVLYPKGTNADHDVTQQKVQPLLVLHGFGFGVVPYITLIYYLVANYAGVVYGDSCDLRRPIIVPEFRWLGLLPNGGITIRWVVRSIGDIVKDCYHWIHHQYERCLRGGLISMIARGELTSFGWHEEIGEKVPDPLRDVYSRTNWEQKAPHMKKNSDSEWERTGIYLPTMPEVVDEVVSFVRFVNGSMTKTHRSNEVPRWCKDRDTPLVVRMIGKSLMPALSNRSYYETQSYRNFWMSCPPSSEMPARSSPSSAKVAEQSTPSTSPTNKRRFPVATPSPKKSKDEMFEANAFGGVDFLNPANDLEEISLSRHEFLTRVRLGIASNKEGDLGTPQCESTVKRPVDLPDDSVSLLMNHLKLRIHRWFDHDQESKSHSRPSTPSPTSMSALWDYQLQEGDCLEPWGPLEFSIIAHSYGTAIASCVVKSYQESIRQVVLLDPICWIVQLTKKAQLCALPPWKVKLFDRSYSPQSLSFISSSSWSGWYSRCGVNAVDLNGKPVAATSMIHRWVSLLAWVWHGIPSLWDWVVDRLLLYVYWYTVYRDFGTRWTTGRQLQGHEYIDDGTLATLAKSGQLLVAVGLKDLIVSSHSVVQHLKSKSSEGFGPKVIVNNDHHGICLLRVEVLREVLQFLNGSSCK